MSKGIIILLISVLLVGCTSAENRERIAVSNAKATCASLGFKVGTERYLRCYNQVHANEIERDAAWSRRQTELNQELFDYNRHMQVQGRSYR